VELSVGKRLFALALVISLSASGFLAILILLFGNFDDTSARILATTGLIGLLSLLALPAGVLLDRGRSQSLAWILIALALVTFVVALTLVWGDSNGESGWKAAGTLALFTGACSQTAATTSRRRETDTSGVRLLYRGSVVGAFLAATISMIAIWQEIEGDGYYRGLGAVVVADLLTVLLQPAVRRMAGRSSPPSDRRASVRFVANRMPSDEAIEEAKRSFERHGVRIESVERRS
jgi:hypothetical protein